MNISIQKAQSGDIHNIAEIHQLTFIRQKKFGSMHCINLCSLSTLYLLCTSL